MEKITKSLRPNEWTEITQNIRGVPSIGKPVYRNAYVADDLKDRYLGADTFVNYSRPILFKLKEDYIIDESMADYLSQLLTTEYFPLLNTTQDPKYTIGLAGNDVKGEEKWYFKDESAHRYEPDERARISVGTYKNLPGVKNVPKMVMLPGSTLAIEACKKGYPAGLVKIKNPANETGYVQVGGPGFVSVLREFANAGALIDINDMQHFVAQGGMYGLGPIYYRYGIQVKAEKERDGTVMYTTAFNDTELRKLCNNRGFINSVQLYYRENLTNPDQKVKGRYGAASAFLRHASSLSTKKDADTGESDAIVKQVQKRLKEGESLSGFAHWIKDYKTFNQRRGLTAFPLRDSSGNPLKMPALSPQQGHCNYYGSGPGVSGTSSDPFGFRFTKRARSYKSSGRPRRWSPIARDPGAPKRWYVCANTPSYTVNPNRSVYGKGQSRGIDKADLVEALKKTAEQKELEWADPENLYQLYSDFTFYPQKYKANPLFIRPGFGFNLGAPKENIETLVKKKILTKEERDNLKGKSLSRFWKHLSTQEDVTNAITGQDIEQKVIQYPDTIKNIGTRMGAEPSTSSYYY
jgi:hypothetical protein